MIRTEFCFISYPLRLDSSRPLSARRIAIVIHTMQLALVSAFAGLALAGPLGARQETLKPFKQPAFGSSKKCGVSQMINDHNTRKWKSEDCQGTLLYCRRKFFQESNEKFESTEECLGSREPAPSSTKPDDYNPTNSVEPGSPVIQTKPTRDELAGAPVVSLQLLNFTSWACGRNSQLIIDTTTDFRDHRAPKYRVRRRRGNWALNTPTRYF